MDGTMSDYTNAAPSPSALFDNVPTWFARSDTATVTVVAKPREYVDGVTAIWANGRTQRGRCRADKVLTAADARTALEHGALCVFVAREDAGTVMEAVQGNG